MCRTMMYILFVAVTPVLAVPVCMEFQGEIIEHHYDPAIGESIPVGSLFEGLLSYDTDIVSEVQHNPGNSSYICDAAAELSIIINDLDFISSSVSISISYDSDPIENRIGIRMLEFTEYESINWVVAFTFANYSEVVLDSTDLPILPLEINNWPFAQISISDGENPGMHVPHVIGQVTSITPEPASLALLAIGGVVVVRRR